MKKKIIARILSALLVCTAVIPAFAGCGEGNNKKKDSIVIMTEELSGLFNPFYATSGADMDVVGMTQIGMLSTDRKGRSTAGKDEPTVVLDFDGGVYNATEDKTVYKFVLKNGLQYSDGTPLTMNDVLFSMYELLDPVYTGSSTMYSTDIVGLKEYRKQTTDENVDDNQVAAGLADARLYELRRLFVKTADPDEDEVRQVKVTQEVMYQSIEDYVEGGHLSKDYKDAVATKEKQSELAEKTAAEENAYYISRLKQDYDHALETFKKEIKEDYLAAKESYDLTVDPYKKWAKQMKSDIFKFFLYEGYIIPEYEKIPGSSKDDLLNIKKFDNTDIVDKENTEEKAINRVYNDNIYDKLDAVLSIWRTAGTLMTEYTAEALSIALRNNTTDGELPFPNIEGIISLGHMNDSSNTVKVEEVTIGGDYGSGKTYTVAHEHNPDGTPKNADEYDVLQITINGIDPKAIYNFGFTVAPVHYYSADANGVPQEVDISNDKFGVVWADSDFQSKVIQSQKHVEVPVGAGPFMATNENNADNPKGDEFWRSSVVYFKKNEKFMFPVKADKIRYQVVSSANALDKLQKGEVDYVTPSFTLDNANRLEEMTKKGFVQLDSWNLGYGYIGINAGIVTNIYVRRAIMSAMQTEAALAFYKKDTCKTIDWPMSMESWAYPFDSNHVSEYNYVDYMNWETVDNDAPTFNATKEKIRGYMREADKLEPGNSKYKVTFTVAGAAITEHPVYAVFKQAAEILNSIEGWRVDVKADSQALTKLATGSLAVWAAAWGSTLDPDMYQIYHIDSKATSVYAWGYREIKNKPESIEYGIISELATYIDAGRATLDQDERARIYKDAMSLVLDLAVEMPVYQRKTLFAYNGKTLKGLPSQEMVDSFNGPLSEIWNIELIKN